MRAISNKFHGRCRCGKSVPPGKGVVSGRKIWCIDCAGPGLDQEAYDQEFRDAELADRDEIHGFDDAW